MLFVVYSSKKLLLPVSQGSNTLPVGTILPYIGALEKIPHGWALCDGTGSLTLQNEKNTS